MSRENQTTVLSEHDRVVSIRHILAIVNFFAIFAATAVTLFFAFKRGMPHGILMHLWALAAVNVVQIVLCVIDYLSKRVFGTYLKWIAPVSYVVGAVWVLGLAGELFTGTMELGSIRLDLAIIAGVSLIEALAAYIVWPMLDRKALDAMTRQSVRGDEHKRHAKSRKFVGLYSALCVVIVLLQGCALLAYKMPPKVYDLFSDTRALEYTETTDGEGYVVTNVYRGTSPIVNIPATYNNKPVVSIARGALVDDTLLEKYKIQTITIGTPTTAEDGTESTVSYLRTIEAGAISADRIESIVIPASVRTIGDGAIKSASLATVRYEAAADFSMSYLECPALKTVTMAGARVGNIVSLDGMPAGVTIEVSKDIYNTYRKNNLEYVGNFRPILAEGEICIDFYTGCDYYIDSIFNENGGKVELRVSDLKNSEIMGASLAVDTAAYIRDPKERGTDGAKADSAFRGWYFDELFADECVFTEQNTVVLDRSTSLYAKWIDEYHAELDWGTFTPAGAKEVEYWTAEDNIVLPCPKDRAGYSAGVVWSVDGSGEEVTDTHTLTKSVNLTAMWLLDAPTVSITDNTAGDENFQKRGDNIIFTYDENRKLTLTASHTHGLAGVTYETEWKTGDQVWDYAETTAVQNVDDSDTYTLYVTAIAPLGERSEGTASVTVQINRKDLGINDYVEMPTTEVTYNGRYQTVAYRAANGGTNMDGIRVSYTYATASNDAPLGSDGVKDAGEYHVRALFEKDDEEARSNYNTVTKNCNFTIKPYELVFDRWSGNGMTSGTVSGAQGLTTVYDGNLHTVTITFGGLPASDDLNITYIDNSATDAGSHTATARVGNQNYTTQNISANLTCGWEITQKEITIAGWRLDGSSGTSVGYNGSAHTASAQPQGMVGDESVNFRYTAGGDYVTTATESGEYTSMVTGVDDDNYYFDVDAANARFAWKINPRTLTVSFQSAPVLTYNGAEQGIVASVTGFAEGDLDKFSLNNFSWTGSTESLRVAGAASSSGQAYELTFYATAADTYTATVAALSSSEGILRNYALSRSATRDFTINPKQLSFRIASSYTYNGQEQDLTVVVDGFVSKDLASVVYSSFTTTGSATTSGAYAGSATSSDYRLKWKGKDAGSYEFSITAYADGNYTLTPWQNRSFTIARKTIHIDSWTAKNNSTTGSQPIAEGGSLSYNGSSGYTLSPSFSGVETSDTVVLTLSNETQTNANTYKTTATLGTQYTNYTLSSSNASINWTIEPYELDISWRVQGGEALRDANTLTYRAEDYILEPVFTPFGSDEIELTYSGETALTAKNVGSYAVSVTGTGNGNYTASGKTSFEWQIVAKTVNVTWTEKAEGLTYNGKYQGPAFTLEGLLPQDVEAGLSVRASYSGTVFYQSGSPSGTHTFTVETDGEYRFTGTTNGFALHAGSYSVSVTAILSGGHDSSNYTVSGDACSFSIEKKELSLTGTWQYVYSSENGVYSEPLVYKGTTITLTTAIAEGSLVTRETASSVDVVTLSYAGNAFKNHSESGYTAEVIGLSGADCDDYKLPAEGLTLSWNILRKPVKFAWSGAEYTYNGTLQEYTARIESGASSDDDGKLYSGDIVTLVYLNNSKTEVGVFQAQVASLTGSAADNYTIDGSSNATSEWQIKACPLSTSGNWTWTFSSVVYNGKAQYPTATYRFNGTTVNITAYTIDEHPSLDSIDVGTYTVRATELDNKNFTLDGVAENLLTHTFTIEKKDITLKWQVEDTGLTLTPNANIPYDGKTHTATALVEGLAEGDELELNYSNNTFEGAQSYTLSVTPITDDNYRLSTTSVSFTVTQLTITLVWYIDAEDGALLTSAVYDGLDHTAIAVMSGYIESDKEELELSYSNNAFKDAGTSYRASATLQGAKASNYTLSTSSTSFSVAKRPVSIVWHVGEKSTQDGDWTGIFAYAGTNCNALHGEITNLAGEDKQTDVSVHYTVRRNGSSDSLHYNYLDAAGSYIITADSVGAGTNGNRSANYTVDGASEKTLNVTVNPCPVKIVWAGEEEVEFDGNSHGRTVTVTTNDPTNFPEAYTLLQGTDYELSGTAQRNVTSGYTFSIRMTNANYTLSGAEGESSAKLTITPLVVELEWSNFSGSYDGQAHTATATIKNLKNSDVVNIAYYRTRTSEYGDNTASGSNQATNAGTYTIEARSLSGSSSNNYTLAGCENSGEGSITITKVEVNVAWTYNGEPMSGNSARAEYNPSPVYPSATVTAFYNNESHTLRETTDYRIERSGELTSIGQTAFTVKEGNSTNYAFNGEGLTATVEVYARQLTLTWNLPEDKTVAHGGTFVCSVTSEGVYGGDHVEFRLTYLRNGQPATEVREAGYYTVTVALAGDDAEKYTISGENSKTFEIAEPAAEAGPEEMDEVALTERKRSL